MPVVELADSLAVARQAWRMVGDVSGWESVVPPDTWVIRRSIVGKRGDERRARGEKRRRNRYLHYKSIMLPLKVVMLKDIKASCLFWHRPS